MTQREEWIHAIQGHEREVARLRREVRALDAAAPAAHEDRTRREIEYATALMIRHEITLALLSSRLATPLSS